MKVLVACEFSGIVRDAFLERGHDVLSCDFLPTEKPGKHYQGNVLDILNNGFDLMIAHPPCTYLANSGVKHLYIEAQRWKSGMSVLWFAIGFIVGFIVCGLVMWALSKDEE